MSFDLKNLHLFVRVATLGAIGRAGAEFGFSPTNTSQRIQALEDELDVKLLNRTTRAVSLTPDGELFLDHARRILEDIEDARTALSHNSASVSGRLRVTASASFGRSHIVPFVPEFLRLYPDVQLDLHLTDTVVDIIEQGFDLAFRIGDLAPSSLLAQKLDDDPRMLVAAPDYLARMGTPETPQDLARHACLTMKQRDIWHLIDASEHVHDVRVSGPVTVSLGDAVVDWTLAGVGIGNASLWHTGHHIRAGRLVPVLPELRAWPASRIWAVRPPGRLMHARVKAFLDFMRDRIVETNKTCYADLI
ncbi:D-malate degradation protein R [Ruegeria sp. THAF57]|uniref:LysR family transcriptional regulator n=1 Tax=Ruegeria sp. THAF57 TaxID=2744555 RepID=UPI0015DDE936|nr:LysR family transcriptional regulator [Ruegeria sp. THAF57]CAD0187195.1 D-malate degradation protein R [Ruegeria sp. THAF57]